MSLFDSAAPAAKKKPARKKTASRAPEPARELSFTEADSAGFFPSDSAPKILTVSEYLDRVNNVLKEEDVSIQGEVTGFQPHPSGAYFSLKDKNDGSVLQCYANPYLYRSFGIALEDGLEVKVGGFANVWKPKGRLSFLVQSLELVGEGALQKAYEALKKKLKAEGLLERKRPLPEFVGNVGLVTSRTGAVIGDFRENLLPRNVKLFLYPVRVEGAQAAPEVVRAIRWFNKNRPELDVLVVMRGGGSLEDLQAFNSESVAREIFASQIPTICAIGHDRDVPIACLVGDQAPSTPTAAAVLINSSWQRLSENLPVLSLSLVGSFQKTLLSKRHRIRHLAGRATEALNRILNLYRAIGRRLFTRYDAILSAARQNISAAERFIVAVSPEKNLKLGYSIVFNSRGEVLKDARNIKRGDKLNIRLHRAEVESTVENIKEKNN